MKEVYHCDPLTFAKLPDHLVELHRKFYMMELRQEDLDIKKSNLSAKVRSSIGK